MGLKEDLATYAKAVSDDVEHGASHILKIASGSLHTALLKHPETDLPEIRESVRGYALSLIGGQRQMAAILNFSNNLLRALDEVKDDSMLVKALKELTFHTSKSSAEALDKIAMHANAAIDGNRFITHSRSSTLLRFIVKARDRDGLTVFVTQSRPGSEGKLLAGELSVAGIKTLLIEDAEAMKYISQSSALLIGADAVIPSGIVNKVGTHLLALGAHDAGIPVYCLTESTKIWPFEEPITSSINGRPTAIAASMGLFEIIPSKMLKMLILETGPTTMDQISLSRQDVKIAPEIRKLVGA